MMEYNDMVTVVDRQDIELRGIEVLIKLVPFIERDVEERCAKLDEYAQGMVALMRGVKAVKPGCLDDVEENNVYEDYERMKGRENERLERLRRAILERAERLFPELRVGSEGAEAREDFRPVSAEAEPSFNAAVNERDAQCVFSGEGDGCPPDRAKG